MTQSVHARKPGRSPNEREQIVAQWRSSGLSAAKFAAENDVGEASLWKWYAQRHKARPCDRPSPETPTFVPVRVVPERKPSPELDSQSSIELMLANGNRIRVNGAMTVDILRTLAQLASGAESC